MKFLLTIYLIVVCSSNIYAIECIEIKPNGFDQRRINPASMDDWSYIKCRATAGFSYEEYHVGLILLTNMKNSIEGYKPREGVKWLIKAAKQGQPHAQKALAEIYYYGKYEQDINKELAYQWFYLGNSHKGKPILGLDVVKNSLPEEKRKVLQKKAIKLLNQK